MALGWRKGPGPSSLLTPPQRASTRPEETTVRSTRRTRLAAALPAAIVLGLATFTASLTWQVPGVRAGSGALDAQATEIVRLINGARVADGLPALNIDPFLAAKARDGAIPCPDDPAKSIAGRAQDFTAYGQMSHSLRLCDAASYTLSGTLFVSLLQSSWSYGSGGEIDLVTGGCAGGAFLYDYHGWQRWPSPPAGNGMWGGQTSWSHWNIIMG